MPTAQAAPKPITTGAAAIAAAPTAVPATAAPTPVAATAPIALPVSPAAATPATDEVARAYEKKSVNRSLDVDLTPFDFRFTEKISQAQVGPVIPPFTTAPPTSITASPKSFFPSRTSPIEEIASIPAPIAAPASPPLRAAVPSALVVGIFPSALSAIRDVVFEEIPEE